MRKESCEVGKEKESLIGRAKEEDWIVCTYGLGYLGKKLYEEIPGVFGLKTNLFSDSDSLKVDAVALEGIKGIHKQELLAFAHPVLVFVLVDDPYDLQIKEDLSANPNLVIVTLRELAEMDYVKELLYGKDLFEKYLQLETRGA